MLNIQLTGSEEEVKKGLEALRAVLLVSTPDKMYNDHGYVRQWVHCEAVPADTESYQEEFESIFCYAREKYFNTLRSMEAGKYTINADHTHGMQQAYNDMFRAIGKAIDRAKQASRDKQ